MKLGTEPFSIQWSKARDQAKRCEFSNQTKVMAARYAVLFNTSDTRLSQKVLAENTEIDAMIKLGLSYEHTNKKAEQMGNAKMEDMVLRRMVQEEVNRVNQGAKGEPTVKT